jgi:hypothetical protein
VGAAAAFVEKLQERGRTGFGLKALLRETGLGPAAARQQLSRLSSVVQLHPRSDFYLAVDPLHRASGSTPVEWWIDDFFRDLERPYYIGLLSAAVIHGASPQAIQVTQVVSDTYRPDLRVGRRRIQFTQKEGAGKTPMMTPRGARSRVMVSTPGATVFDLVRFQKKLGGWPRILDVIDALAERGLKAGGIAEALVPDLELKLLQRTGFLLNYLGRGKLARPIAERLRGSRLQPAEIRMSTGVDAPGIEDNPWGVVGTLGPRSGS